MPNALVADQLNFMTNQLQRDRQLRRRDDLSMQDLGIQRAGLGLQEKNALFRNASELARAKKEQWLTEPVTIGQAIDTHKKWTPQEKQALKMHVPEKERDEFLNIITTRGKLNDALEKWRASKQEQSYQDRILKLREREVTAKEKQSKENQQMTKTQWLSDLQRTFTVVTNGMKDEYGSVRPEMEKAYREKENLYKKDKQLILRGKEPVHLYTPDENKPEPAPAPASKKNVIRTGVDKTTGRKVVQYEDGTVEYAAEDEMKAAH